MTPEFWEGARRGFLLGHVIGVPVALIVWAAWTAWGGNT